MNYNYYLTIINVNIKNNIKINIKNDMNNVYYVMFVLS